MLQFVSFCASFYAIMPILSAYPAEMDLQIFRSNEDVLKVIEKLKTTCLAGNYDIDQLPKGPGEGFPDNNATKDFLYCIAEQSGILNESGNLDFEPIMGAVPEYFRDTLRQIGANCQTNVEYCDSKQKVFDFIKCFQSYDPRKI